MSVELELNLAQKQMLNLWEEHTKSEFESKSADLTLSTMSDNPHVYNIPTMTGGDGLKAVREFYTKSFIPKIPADTKTSLISRTIGNTQIVDELIFKFTHSIEMDWMLPHIPPTGKYVEVALVVIIGFLNGKISHEHIYWDQASVLVQLGLLDINNLPVNGIKSAHKVAKLRQADK